MIAVINYGMGNLRSVINAFEAIGVRAFVANHPQELEEAEKIVLPGVGAFGDGMQNLREAGWVEALNYEVRRNGKLFLGICLGMQLLAAIGTEHGEHEGLNFVAGKSILIDTDGNENLRIPHIGWNDVAFAPDSRLYAGMKTPQAFYFVHSFVLAPENNSLISGVCNHGADFAASVEDGNVLAVQFHPEKSHKAGIALLKNFADLKA
jgi:glutamine amidotransferase